MARRSVQPSTMSLLGLVRHLAEAEFTTRFVARAPSLDVTGARHLGHVDLLRERIDGRLGQ